MNDHSNNQSKRVYEEMTFVAADFLAGIIPMEPPFSGRLDRLAVQDGCTWLGFAPLRKADLGA